MFTKNIFTNKDGIADLVGNILEADYKNKMEELKGNQHKIDKNKNNKIDAHDFKILRGEKSAQKEEVDPTDTTTDTLRGREKTSKNPMLSKKVMMDVPDNVKEEAEQIDELSYDTLNSYMRKKRKVIAKVGDMDRHRGTAKGKKMEKDVENYRKAWQKRDMKEEVVEEDKNKESSKEFKARMNRLSQPNDTTGSTWLKDPRRQAFLDKIPGYKDAMALAHKTTNKGVKEEAEEIDEGSKHAARPRNTSRPGTEPPVKGKIQDRMAAARERMDAKKKDMKEEAEQIDEISKATLTSYATKARAHGEKLSREGEAAMKRTSPKSLNTAYQKFKKATLRHLGASTAERKASMKREDVEQVDEEQLDELSTKTLSSYVKSRGAQLVGGYGDAKKVKGINKALRKIKQKNEDIEQVDEEQLDELSKKTLSSYANKGSSNMSDTWRKATTPSDKDHEKASKRVMGLHRAFTKIGKVKEDIDEEQLDELKKSTLVRYATKANKSSIDLGVKASRARDNDDMETWAKNRNKAEKRDKGIQKAMGKIRKEEVEELEERNKENKEKKNKYVASIIQKKLHPSVLPSLKYGRYELKKEETEQIDERELSKGETAEKERIVKGMKKSLSGFRARYGDKAKSVMYATATARAKKD